VAALETRLTKRWSRPGDIPVGASVAATTNVDKAEDVTGVENVPVNPGPPLTFERYMLVLPFIVEFDHIGETLPVALFDKPDLSIHDVTATPLAGVPLLTVRESAASNHNTHPGMLRGSKP
jgi:hypothetical protein